MIESIGPLVTLYKAIIEGVRSLNLKSKTKKKSFVQRKIISIQIILENIIETAEQIFSIVEIFVKKGKEIDTSTKKELRKLANSQHNNLYELIINLQDDTSDYILRLFAPKLRREIIDQTHRKNGRISQLMWHLNRIDSKNLKKLYNKSYYDDGLELLSQLKSCSMELSEFIKTNINLEDAILIR